MPKQAPLYSPQSITVDLIKRLSRADPPDSPREVRDKTHGLILRHQTSGALLLYVPTGRGRRERPFGKTCDARRIANTSDSLTLGMVRKESQRIRGEVAGGRDYHAERQVAGAVPTLTRFLDDEYEPWALANRKTGKALVERIRACFEDEFGKLKLTEIDKRRMKKWRKGRLDDDVTPATINRDVSALSAAMRHAIEEEVLETHPFAGLIPLHVGDGTIVRALEVAEEKALRAALVARDAKKREERASANEWRKQRRYELLPSISTYADALTPAALVSLETGLRRSELFSLEWVRVDMKKHELEVHWSTSKTARSRTVPLNDTAVDVLRNWWLQCGQPKEGLVFPGMNGDQLKSLRRSYYATLKAAGIERIDKRGRKVNWHSLRHSFGTRLGAANVDPVSIMKLMGHTSLETTKRYLHSEPERMRAAVEKLR